MTGSVERIKAIRNRLAGVSGRKWRYNPEHPMFIGATNAVEVVYRQEVGEDDYPNPMLIDLGRDGKVYETRDGKRQLTKASVENMKRIRAMGEFFQSCREDIGFLLDAMDAQIPTQEREGSD
jgi:hypothetical protein